MSEIIQSSRHKVLRKEEKIYNDWNAEVSWLERLYVASEYMKAGDGAVEDTYEISLDIKRTNEMIDEYKKKLEKAHESLSHLKGLANAEHLLSETKSRLQCLETVKKGNAKLMIVVIECNASLQRSRDEVAESKRDFDQLQKKKQLNLITLWLRKGIVVTEEALLMFHLKYHDEESNLLKAKFIQVGSQIEIAEQNLIVSLI
ncbi:hypothetical protein Tco_1048561 [Tanacetum coccineum]